MNFLKRTQTKLCSDGSRNLLGRKLDFLASRWIVYVGTWHSHWSPGESRSRECTTLNLWWWLFVFDRSIQGMLGKEVSNLKKKIVAASLADCPGELAITKYGAILIRCGEFRVFWNIRTGLLKYEYWNLLSFVPTVPRTGMNASGKRRDSCEMLRQWLWGDQSKLSHIKILILASVALSCLTCEDPSPSWSMTRNKRSVQTAQRGVVEGKLRTVKRQKEGKRSCVDAGTKRMDEERRNAYDFFLSVCGGP